MPLPDVCHYLERHRSQNCRYSILSGSSSSFPPTPPCTHAWSICSKGRSRMSCYTQLPRGRNKTSVAGFDPVCTSCKAATLNKRSHALLQAGGDQNARTHSVKSKQLDAFGREIYRQSSSRSDGVECQRHRVERQAVGVLTLSERRPVIKRHNGL